MAILPVQVADGRFEVVLESGDTLPVRFAGEPISTFLPGWVPLHVLSGFAPLHILCLRHADGRQAPWFLDARMDRLGGTLGELPAGVLAELHRQTLALFRVILHELVAAPAPLPLSGIDELCLLDDTLLDALADMVWADLAGTVTVIDLNQASADARLAKQNLCGVDVRAALSGSLKQAYLERIRNGELLCASPFGGEPAAAELGLMLVDRLTAYRFVDAQDRRVFYMLPNAYHDKKIAVYLPEAAVYCCIGDVWPFRMFFQQLITHAVRHHVALARCLARPARDRKSVNVFIGYPVLHIGHVLWNDLSGLEELIQLLEPAELPQVCILGRDNGSEPYGAVDVLFPEFAGRVLRLDQSRVDVAAYIYENDHFFMRYMATYVRAAVGTRIRAQVLNDPRLIDDRAMARRLHEEGRPCIVLGLRTGNRTLSDPLGFLDAAINHLVKRLGPITVVLDGNNARLGTDATTFYGNFGPARLEEPLLQELRVALSLRQLHRGEQAVIVSTIGAPIACSLFWIMQSRFFIAPWGAGLAKYRWACNKPGFVVSNRYIVTHPEGDARIYHDPNSVESPAPMRIIAPEHVVDVPGDQGFYANFTPDPAAVVAGIDRMLVETAT